MPHVVAGMLLAACVVAVPPAAPSVRAGDIPGDRPLRYLLDDAPSFLFPDAIRGDPIEVDLLDAESGRDGYTLEVEPVVPADPTAAITIRVAFYPVRGKPWALQWDQGDTEAEVVKQQTASSAETTTQEALATYSGTGSTRQIVLDANIMRITLPIHFLNESHVKLPDLTGVQLQHLQAGSDGSVTFQGSPIVDWGALIGDRARIPLPPSGITYDAEGHSQPWNVVPACAGSDCAADLEERVAELEATTVTKGNKRITVTISGWVVKNGGALIDEFREFAAGPQPEGTPTVAQTYNGAICDWVMPQCQIISGNNHEATATGSATLVTDVTLRRIGVGVDNTVLFEPPGTIQYALLVKPTPDATSVALWTPFMPNRLPPGVVSPETAPGLFLDPDAAKPLGLRFDPTDVTTVRDVNQLPTDESTRATYDGAGFLGELLGFYTKPGVDENNPSAAPPGTTVFFSQSVDVFRDHVGADFAHQYLDRRVESSTTAKVIRRASGTRPQVLQSTANGVTTTTGYWDVGRNALIVLRSTCNQCSPKQAEQGFDPVLRAVRRQARASLAT
jgi:hypothetical protein